MGSARSTAAVGQAKLEVEPAARAKVLGYLGFAVPAAVVEDDFPVYLEPSLVVDVFLEGYQPIVVKDLTCVDHGEVVFPRWLALVFGYGRPEWIDTLGGPGVRGLGVEVSRVVVEAHVAGQSTGDQAGSVERLCLGSEYQALGCPCRSLGIGERSPHEVNVWTADVAVQHGAYHAGENLPEVFRVLPGSRVGSTVGRAPVELARGGVAAGCLHSRVQHGGVGSDVGDHVDVAQDGFDRLRQGGEVLHPGPSGAS